MKKVLILLCLYFHVYSGNSASIENVPLYYSLINKAELAIIDVKYAEAKSYYVEAFQNKYPNGKDLYNAFLVSYYSLDTFKAIEYFKKLAFSGLKRGYFIDTIINNHFYKYIAGTSNYDSCYKAGYMASNKKLIKKLDSLFFKDQALRLKGDLGKNMLNSDINNIRYIYKIVREFGWPSFRDIGFWVNGSSPTRENPSFELVFWHNRFNTNSFDTLVVKVVQQGKFRPDSWGQIVLGRKMFGKGLFNYYNYHMNIWTYQKLSQKQKDKINAERAKVFLDNLDDYYKKYLYQSIYNIRFGNDQTKSMFVFLNGILVPPPDQIEHNGIFDE